MAHKIQFRRDTKERWISINPILMEGEVGFELDTRNGKVGDGIHAWNDLEYNNSIVFESISQELGESENLVPSQKIFTQYIDLITKEIITLEQERVMERPLLDLQGSNVVTPTSVSLNTIFDINQNDVVERKNWKTEKYAVRSGDTFYLDIKDAAHESFALVVLYDRDNEIYFKLPGAPVYTLGDKLNILNVTRDGTLLISSPITDRLNSLYNKVDVKFNEKRENLYSNIYIEKCDIRYAKGSTEISPTNIIENSILVYNDDIEANKYWNINEYHVKRGDILYLDIKDAAAEYFTLYTLSDENKEVYYRQLGQLGAILDGKLTRIQIQIDGWFRCSTRADNNFSNKIYANITTDTPSKYLYDNVLWLGTSIPDGCPYPENAAKELGFTCYNNSVGSSGIVVNKGYLGNDRDCKDLCETTAEKRARYANYIGSDYVTEERIDSYSFDVLLLPYINGAKANCNMVVIDHGFNDRHEISRQVKLGRDNINWESNDRTTFTGAFRFLLEKIYAVNRNIQVVIAGYFTKEHTAEGVLTEDVCTMQMWISEYYNIPILPVWDILTVSDDIIPGLNISSFKIFCPDNVHPHSDSTGRSEKLYTAAIVKLLRDYPNSTKSGGENLEDIYTPSDIVSKLESNVAVGAIPVNTKISTLAGLTFSEIINKMLVKEIWSASPQHDIWMDDLSASIVKKSSFTFPDFSAIWNEKLQASTGDNTVYALMQLIQPDGKEYGSSAFANNKEISDSNGDWGAAGSYTEFGKWIYRMTYSYDNGIFTQTSNLGGSRESYVQGKSEVIERIVHVTAPWYINTDSNDVEQDTLIAIGTSKTIYMTLGGKPTIKVPFENSEISVRAAADGKNYLDVAGWTYSTEEKNGVKYKTYSKPVSYDNEMPHEIFIKINK